MELRPYLLCGGGSRRMSRDKALMAHPDGGTLLERAARLLEAAAGPPVLLSGDGKRYTRFGLPEIADARSDCGPLGGILAAIEHAAPVSVLILAVDMPFVSRKDLDCLLENRGPGVTVAMAEGRRHPVLSIWDPKMSGPLRDALEAGRYSVQEFLESLPVRDVELPLAHLRNWNAPADLTWRNAPEPIRPGTIRPQDQA